MTKIIIGAGRRRGLTIAQTHHHAVTRHAPLCLAAPDADAFAHYHLNLISDGVYGPSSPGPFDIVAEDTFQSGAAMMRMSGSDYFRDVVAPDEGQFGDLSTRIFFFAREEKLRSPETARTVGASKALFFLIASSDAATDQLLNDWAGLDAALPSAVLGAVRNLPEAPPEELRAVFSGPPAYAGVMALWVAEPDARREFDAYWSALQGLRGLDLAKSFYVIGEEEVILP